MLVFEWIHASENSKGRILKFLREIDSTMIPVLSARVELELYADKLAKRAETLFVYTGIEDVGSCSVYCNTENAFITSIAVKTEFRRMHIGSEILKQTKQHVKNRGCKKIVLNVYETNKTAISFYLKSGFCIIENKNEWLKMEWKIL